MKQMWTDRNKKGFVFSPWIYVIKNPTYILVKNTLSNLNIIFEIRQHEMNFYIALQGWRNWRGRGAHAPLPHIMTDQITLSQPGTGQIMPTTLLLATPIDFQTFRYPFVCKNGNLGLLYSSSMAFFPNYVLLIIGCSTDPIFELYELVTV